MTTYLVYTLLLALQIVGPEAADKYAYDVLLNGTVVWTLEARRDGAIVRLADENDIVLEIERSDLYAHMYTTYTSLRDQPRAFNLLDAAVQIPPTAMREYRIVVEDPLAGSDPVAPAAGDTSPALDDSIDSSNGDIVPETDRRLIWDVVVREESTYISAQFQPLVIAIHRVSG